MRTHTLAFLITLLLVALATTLHLTRVDQRRFAAEIRRHSTFVHVADPLALSGPVDSWMSPGAHVASRVLSRDVARLAATAALIVPTNLRPAVWWERSNAADSTALTSYRLSLLIGDLQGARMIAARVGHTDRRRWHRELTQTLWQATVESLHELDFYRAYSFGWLYVDVLDSTDAGAASLDEFDVSRNKTLARVLLGESASDRIRSLCGNPGVARSFGRFLGGRYGYALPGTITTSLSRRRDSIATVECNTTTGTVDYRLLATLRDSLTPTMDLVKALRDSVERAAAEDPLRVEAESLRHFPRIDSALRRADSLWAVFVNVHLPRYQATYSALTDQLNVAALSLPALRDDACRYWPLECDYLAALESKPDNEPYSFERSGTFLDRALRVAASCSYLSDDAMFHVLDALAAQRIPLSLLANRRAQLTMALGCLNPDADFGGLIMSRWVSLGCDARRLIVEALPSNGRVSPHDMASCE